MTRRSTISFYRNSNHHAKNAVSLVLLLQLHWSSYCAVTIVLLYDWFDRLYGGGISIKEISLTLPHSHLDPGLVRLFESKKMREVIHCQIGGGGNQIGTKFWELICGEHGAYYYSFLLIKTELLY